MALLGSLAGCRSPNPGVPLAPDDPRPAALLRALEQQSASRHALRGRARLDLDAEDVSLDRPQRMAVERPARLRFEVLGLFDQLAAVIVTDGSHYQVYDARNHDLEEGLVDPQLLWRVARVDLEPSEAVDLILGAPRPDPGLSAGEARAYLEGEIGVHRVDAAGVLREGYRFDGAGQLAEMTLYDANGQRVWHAAFSDYRPVAAPGGADVPFAHDVKLVFPRVDAKVRLVFKQIVLADRLPDALFELQLPAHSYDAGERARPIVTARGGRPRP